MDEQIRLCVMSSMTDPAGDVTQMKHACRGKLRREADGFVLEYDDAQEERAHILLCVQGDARSGTYQARMERRGMTSGTLVFLPGRRESACYTTLYGQIPVAVDTHQVRVEQGPGGGRLLLAYDVYMGGEKSAAAALEITWRV